MLLPFLKIDLVIFDKFTLNLFSGVKAKPGKLTKVHAKYCKFILCFQMLMLICDFFYSLEN